MKKNIFALKYCRTFIVFAGLLLSGSGCGTPSFLITPVSGTYELQEMQAEPGHGWFAGKIAIIEVEGVLMNARSGGFLQPNENPLSLFQQQLQHAANDSSVKAVVLRVNSPGGAVATSDTMYDLVKKFRAKTHKPVIASTQEVDASGAYYISCACDKIVAHPAGLVGSIGVIFETFDAVGTLEKIGLKSESIKSAELKDIASPFKHMTEKERAVLQGLVGEYYSRFQNIVTENRPVHQGAELKAVNDGRVFSGSEAVRLGLADKVGRLDDAVALAKEMSHSPGAAVVMYKRPYSDGGSIYAESAVPEPKSTVVNIPASRCNRAAARGLLLYLVSWLNLVAICLRLIGYS